MQIGTRIMIGLSVLGLGLTGQLAIDALGALRTLGHVQEAQTLNLISDILSATTTQVAKERGVVAGVLAGGAATPVQREAALGQMRQTDALLTRASQALPPAQRDALSADTTVWQAQRGAVQQWLGAAGPAPLGADWFAAGTRAVEAITALRRRLEAQGENEQAMARFEAIRDRLAEMAEFAGRERGLVNAQILAGTKGTAELALVLGNAEGRIDAAWQRIGPRMTSASPELTAAVAAVGKAWFESFAPMHRQVLDAAMKGAAWPVSASEWFDGSTIAIGTMIDAQRGVTAEMTAVSARQLLEPQRTLLAAAALLAFGSLVTLLIAWNLRRRVVQPLRSAMRSIRSIAAGDLDVTLPKAGGHDEIAELIEATRMLQQTALEARSLAREREAERAATELMRTQAMREIGDMVENISDEAMSDVRVMAQELEKMAGQVYTATAAIAGTSAMASADASEACGGTDQAATSARELTSTIHEIARQMELAARSTRLAVERTDSARDIFAALSTSVTEIGEVAGLIAEIAGRTNLLALNATIEAARAGEAGRGFAVVAGEVKLLAQETERSTARITQRIAAIDGTTRQAVEAMGSIALSITELDKIATAVAGAIEEQSVATREIADSVSRAGDASGRAAAEMQKSVDESMQCELTAGQMAKISKDVAGQVASLKGRLVHLMRANSAELDRRRDERYNIRRPARLMHARGEMMGEIVDISFGGSCFVGDELFDWESQHQLRLRIDGLPAQAVHVTRSHARAVHLCFVFASDREQADMKEAVSRLVAASGRKAA